MINCKINYEKYIFPNSLPWVVITDKMCSHLSQLLHSNGDIRTGTSEPAFGSQVGKYIYRQGYEQDCPGTVHPLQGINVFRHECVTLNSSALYKGKLST